MTPKDLQRVAIEPALTLLPAKMTGGFRLLLAIALQESGITHRRQTPTGAARGFWQFEPIGIAGVESHPATAQYATEVRIALSVKRDEVYEAIQYNDVLAAAYARLLLWRHPSALPLDEEGAWRYYLDLWAPGQPHRHRWSKAWSAASLGVKE